MQTIKKINKTSFHYYIGTNTNNIDRGALLTSVTCTTRGKSHEIPVNAD